MSEIKPKSKKVDTLFVEVYDRRDSGFILDGTENTKFEERLNAPSILNIPNQGKRRLPDGVGVESIRYIAGETEIRLAEQKKAGIEPSPVPMADKIFIDGGSMTVANEGETAGFFEYIRDVFYNANAPKRSEKATILYKVVDLNKIAEEINEKDIMANEAAALVYTLQEKRGGVWVYQEERINSWCELFAVFAETYPTKINILSNLGKINPKNFLDKIAIFEQTAATDVTHALQLNVIKFEQNIAIYDASVKTKAIKNLGVGSMKHDEKIKELATWLLSADGKEAYKELKTELEHAKEKQK